MGGRAGPSSEVLSFLRSMESADWLDEADAGRGSSAGGRFTDARMAAKSTTSSYTLSFFGGSLGSSGSGAASIVDRATKSLADDWEEPEFDLLVTEAAASLSLSFVAS